MGGIKISELAYFLPEKRITNEELSARFGNSPEDIFKRTGVRSRFHTTPEFVMSDMAAIAANKILEEKSELKNKIDAIVLVGHGYEYKAPVTSAILQDKLGLSQKLLAIDLPQGCSGYINGLGVSYSLLNTGIAKKILLMTADTPSYVIHPDNAELLAIFSDSGTASIIETVDEGFNGFVFGTDGRGADSLKVYRSGTRYPADAEYLSNGKPNGQMEMKSTEIFLFAMRTVPALMREVLEKNNLEENDIDLYILHQANSFMLEVLRKKIKIPKEKFFNDIEEVGNTVSSSIPLALKKAEQQGRLKKGMKVLLAGFGIGYTWGATVITY